MTDESNTVTRRNVLRATAGTVTATGVAGLAAGADGEGGDGLVTFNVGYDADSGRRAALEAASEVEHDFSFDAVTVRATPAAVAGLEERPDVRYVERSGQVRAFDETLSWGLNRVDGYVDGPTGTGVDVAIIDSGIDSDHPDLDENLGTGKAIVECSGSDCDEKWDDDRGHGTSVASIAGAPDNGRGIVGVAPDATLHAVKVLDDTGSGTDDDVAAGLDWVANQGYHVANMSLGSDDFSSVIDDAIDNAASSGVLVVAAAGNDCSCCGSTTDCCFDVSGICDHSVAYPARDSKVVAVSATNENDHLACFSATGTEIELAAPGSVLQAADVGGGTRSFCGTSASSPFVAGAGALLVAQGFSRTGARDQLKQTAEDIGLSSDEQGAGLLDVEAATGSDAVPFAETHPATDVTDSSAVLHGELVELNGASSVDVTFEVDGPDSTFTVGSDTLTSPGTFSWSVTGLESATSYEYRVLADGSDGDSGEGDWELFFTDGDSL